MRVFLSLCAVVLLSAVIAPLCHAAAPATYTGEATVVSQADAERNEALKTALANVVIEVTGDSGVLARSDVARAVGEAPRYVLQYQYRRGSASDGTQPGLVLVAQFDRVAVDGMLRSLGLAAAGDTAGGVVAEPSEAAVWISGIQSASDYARALGYLDRLDLVSSAQPVEARGDGVLVHLSLTTDLGRFLETLGPGEPLSVTNASPPVDGVDATLALVPQ